jgi:hypothetical protein
MASAQDIKSGMLSAESGVQEVLRALYFYGADYIMFKIGRREKLVHKEQLISLMELGNERTTIDEMSVMTLPEPVSAKTRAEDVPPDTVLLMFFRKEGGPAGVLSMTSFGEYRERKIKEAEAVYPEWWGAPIPLLYMDNERVALNDAAGTKIPCEARDLAAQADKMKRDGIITVKDKKREFTFSLRLLEENVYLIEDISGDFEMAEELVWWAAVGKAFVRRLEENGAVVRRMSPLEAPPASAAEVIPCSWENESLGSVVIGMPGDAGWNATQETDAGHEEKEGETVSSNTNRVTEPDSPSNPEPQKTEVPAQSGEPEIGEPETVPVPEKPSRGKRARETGKRPPRKGKHERSALWTPKDDLNLDLNAISEPSKVENESLADQPEIPIPSAWYESFGPFGKPAAKRGKAAAQTAGEKVHDEESAVPEQNLPRETDQEGGDEVKIEEPAGKTAAPPRVLDKNAARRAYGGSQRRKVPGGSLEKA